MDETLENFEDKNGDEMERFGIALPSKVEALGNELFHEISKSQIAVSQIYDTFEKRSAEAWNAISICQITELRYIKVYRLMQEEEDLSEGLDPKDEADISMSIIDHIENGSYRSSCFISTSKSIEVRLFYASKAMYLRGAQAEVLRIEEIRLDLDAGYVLDLSGSYEDANEQRFEVGIEGGVYGWQLCKDIPRGHCR
jgi:hypothetical protein